MPPRESARRSLASAGLVRGSHACLQSPLIEIQSPLLEILLKPKDHRLQHVVHVEDAARQLPEFLRGCMRSTSRGTPRYSDGDEMMMRW